MTTSINTKIKLALILPNLCIAFILGVYIIISQINHENRLMQQYAEDSTKAFAYNLSFPLAFYSPNGSGIGTLTQLNKLSKQHFDKEHVKSVKVSDKNGEFIICLGCPLDNEQQAYKITENIFAPAISLSEASPADTLFSEADANNNTTHSIIGSVTVLTFLEASKNNQQQILLVSTIILVIGFLISLSLAHYFSQKIIKRNKQLEEANRAKDDFLARVSHEVRTPLHAIQGYTSLIKKDKTNIETEKFTQIINMASKQISTVIEDVLNFSKLKANAIVLERREFDVYDRVNNIISMLKPMADEKQLTLTLKITSTVPRVIVNDPDRLTQILTNLLNNAIKFTEEGGIVFTIDTRPSYNIICFIISDTGIGISKAQQSIIFEAFQQADNSITRRFGGTGLGLPIVQNLVTLMNGEITLNSQSDKGTTIKVDLPLAFKKQSIPTEDNKCDDEVADDETTTMPQWLKPLKVLIVEDAKFGRDLIVSYLKDWKIETNVATDGQQAIDTCHSKTFDIILLDLHMPKVDGINAAKTIRKIPRNRHARLILTTADTLTDIGKDAALFDEHLYKPLSEETLLNTLACTIKAKYSKNE